MGIALAALCEFYNSGGNNLSDDPIRVAKAPHELDCVAVGIRHHLDVGRLKYCVVEKWNYRDSCVDRHRIYLGVQNVTVQRVPQPLSPVAICNCPPICLTSELIIFIPR